MEHFIEGSISERTFGGEAEKRIKFFTESAGKVCAIPLSSTLTVSPQSTVTRKIDSNDALQKLQFVMFADELLSQPKWMEVLCAVSGLAVCIFSLDASLIIVSLWREIRRIGGRSPTRRSTSRSMRPRSLTRATTRPS